MKNKNKCTFFGFESYGRQIDVNKIILTWIKAKSWKAY